ncbi:MAG: hypothetical protein WD603_01030 [Patescibacteria group bacterium]
MRSLPLFSVPEYRAVLWNGFCCLGPLLGSAIAILLLPLIFPETPTGAGFLLVFGSLIALGSIVLSAINLIAFSEAVGNAIGHYRRYGYDLRE